MRLFVIVALVFASVFATPRGAAAQTREAVVPENIKGTEPEKLEGGWKPSLTLGATGNLLDSRAVVGAQPGTTINLGTIIEFDIDYLKKPHEWRNSVDLVLSFSKTPQLAPIVKTADRLFVESVYLYRPPAVPWVGPFVRADLDTQVLPGADVRAAATNWVIQERDGTLQAARRGTRIGLTDPFQPLKLSQAAGVYLTPVDKPAVKLEFKAGAAAREVFVGRSLAVSADKIDDPNTPETEIKLMRLRDFTQLGGLLSMNLGGTVVFEKLGPERPLVYAISARFIAPFFTNPDPKRSLLKSTYAELRGKLGIKLFAWMSLDYELMGLYDPLLLDRWQVRNNLMLTFSWAVVKSE